MFRYNVINREEVQRFETPFYENFIQVHLEDTSVNPTKDPSWKPVHCIMPSKYRQYADRIRNLTVYEDDVWVVTFPKAGTTWTQEMVWLIDHDLDYKTASTAELAERSVFIEASAIISNIVKWDTIEKVEKLSRPRHIKTHLPLGLLPKQLWTVKPKIICTARNPKDVTTSYMHHYRHLQGFNGSREDFLEGILADKIMYCPQIKHTIGLWTVSHRHHVLFLHYEEMKRSLPDVIQKVCDFFGKSYTEKQLKDLEHHLMFDAMKNNNAANHQTLVARVQSELGVSSDFKFMRKGQIGAYKDELPEEFVIKMDKLIQDQLRGTGFEYKE